MKRPWRPFASCPPWRPSGESGYHKEKGLKRTYRTCRGFWLIGRPNRPISGINSDGGLGALFEAHRRQILSGCSRGRRKGCPSHDLFLDLLPFRKFKLPLTLPLDLLDYFRPDQAPFYLKFLGRMPLSLLTGFNL
jgi:hypothetical protein